jgi:integrase
MVVKGSHPVHAKRAEKLAAAASNANTFDAVAAEFEERRGQEWTPIYRKHFRRFLERDVSRDIGPLPIREIDASLVLAVLRKVEDRGAHSQAIAGRSYIGQVFRYAIATGKATVDPTYALRGALTKVEVSHNPPLRRADIPAFFEGLAKVSTNRQTEIAVRLLAYLFTRTIELRSAPWTEFNLNAAEWRIPGERMKMGTPHIVPLPTQTVALLRELYKITGHQMWLFPNTQRPKTYMGETTINRVIERAGFSGRFTAHGFRATASTILHEAGFDTRLIELQLAHQDRNKSRASYNHAERLPERQKMMQTWADMLDALAQPQSNVVPMKAAERSRDESGVHLPFVDELRLGAAQGERALIERLSTSPSAIEVWKIVDDPRDRGQLIVSTLLAFATLPSRQRPNTPRTPEFSEAERHASWLKKFVLDNWESLQPRWKGQGAELGGRSVQVAAKVDAGDVLLGLAFLAEACQREHDFRRAAIAGLSPPIPASRKWKKRSADGRHMVLKLHHATHRPAYSAERQSWPHNVIVAGLVTAALGLGEGHKITKDRVREILRVEARKRPAEVDQKSRRK